MSTGNVYTNPKATAHVVQVGNTKKSFSNFDRELQGFLKILVLLIHNLIGLLFVIMIGDMVE